MPDRRSCPTPTTEETAGLARGTPQGRLGPIAEFLRTEAGGGAVLLSATVAALLWANGPWQDSYEALWGRQLAVGPGRLAVREDLRHWVNDALMAAFFLLVGLEIKREAVGGELSDRRAATLPALAALGGMVLPAALFAVVAGPGAASRGWGIPMATDIAFAVGVLTLLGRRAPAALRVFLLAVATVDDVGAILVIALFYSGPLGLAWLGGMAAALAMATGLRRLGVARALAYLPVGTLAWYCAYRAGIHPTIAAVALGLLTPAGAVKGRRVLEDLERRLHPWSSHLVVPLFALANAGILLQGDRLAAAAGSRLTWGVVAGLVVGKTLGITTACVVAVRAGIGRLPVGVTLRHALGAGALGGIGFTVSLFVTDLAFPDPALQSLAKVGILGGSLASALLGVGLLLSQPFAGSTGAPPADDEGAAH